jgi:hypothetical protein
VRPASRATLGGARRLASGVQHGAHVGFAEPAGVDLVLERRCRLRRRESLTVWALLGHGVIGVGDR